MAFWFSSYYFLTERHFNIIYILIIFNMNINIKVLSNTLAEAKHRHIVVSRVCLLHFTIESRNCPHVLVSGTFFAVMWQKLQSKQKSTSAFCCFCYLSDKMQPAVRRLAFLTGQMSQPDSVRG